MQRLFILHKTTKLILAAEEEREATARAFRAYGRPLEMVTSFRYLGRVISEEDNDWLAVARNLSWTRAVWSKMARILRREGVSLRVSGLCFKAMVQVVLLFRSDTWVVTPRMGKALGGYQAQVARRLTG